VVTRWEGSTLPDACMKKIDNYLRPHTSLDRKTPAEVAGIDLSLQGNTWEAIIKKAAKAEKKGNE